MAAGASTKKSNPKPRYEPFQVRDFNLPELMGFSEVAECVGVAGNNLQFIKDLPQPVAHVRATHLWLADEVRKFAKVYQARRDARLRVVD